MFWLENHHGDVLTSLLTIHEDPAFMDLKLCLGNRVEGGEEVAANRIQVALLSTVFRKLLTHDLKERREGKIRLEAISVEAWDVILNFYYSGRKLVSAENVEEMITIADMYELTALKDHCCKTLSENLSEDDCLAMLEIARNFHMEESARKILEFCRENFDAVSKNEHFLRLSKEELLELLGGSYLVTTEDSLSMAILNWLERNATDGETVLELIQQLSLEKVSRNCFMRQILHHKFVCRNDAVREMVIEELEKQTPVSVPCGSVTPYRRGREAEEILVLGHDGSAMHAVYTDEDMKEWHSLPAVHVGDHFAACAFDDSVYVTGGYTASKETHVFHLRSKTWSKGPDLQIGRHVHSMVTIGDSMYVVMGVDERSLSSIEAFSRDTRYWGYEGYMQVATRVTGVAAVGDQILAMGGWEDSGKDIVQVFNVRTKTATILSYRLPNPMTRVRGTSLGDGAVFIGEEGDLVFVSCQQNGNMIITHKKLTGFGKRAFFGILADHLLTFIGGGNPGQPGVSVSRFTLEGEPADSGGLAPLPVALKVHGVFRVHLPRQ